MICLLAALVSCDRLNGRGVLKIRSNCREPIPGITISLIIRHRNYDHLKWFSRNDENRAFGGVWSILEKSIYKKPRQTHSSNKGMILTNLDSEANGI